MRIARPPEPPQPPLPPSRAIDLPSRPVSPPRMPRPRGSASRVAARAMTCRRLALRITFAFLAAASLGLDRPLVEPAVTPGMQVVVVAGDDGPGSLRATIFTQVADDARPFLARLRADGGHDLAYPAGTGPDGPVRAIAMLADGRTLIGGDFTTVNGLAARRIARLHADGSLDRDFDAGPGADDTVWAIAVASTGATLIGGRFATVGGMARPRVARLRPDGTIDPSFDPVLGPSGTVLMVQALDDGSVYVAGDFLSVDQMLDMGRGAGIYNRGVCGATVIHLSTPRTGRRGGRG